LFIGGTIVNTGLTSALALKAPLASPSFTGSVVSAGDVSLNAGLRVASDSSFNGNLFIGGTIVNTGLTSALALKAPLASPSFTGSVVSAGDVSLNAGLRVASDSSFNSGVYFGGSIQTHNIIPVGNLTHNIGNETQWYGNLYVNHIHCGSNSITIGDSKISSNNGSVAFDGNSRIEGDNQQTMKQS
jgi:hypothetical protein